MKDSSGNTFSDNDLVSRVLHGETNAFSQILKNTEALTAQIVFKMVSNAEDRRDIAQDIYLKAFKNLAGFRFESKLSTWIAQIAYRTCLNHLEKKRLVLPATGENENTEEILDKLSPRPASFALAGAESVVHTKNLKAILDKAIDNLPPVYRTLITLFHHEELSYEEVSSIAGLPVGTVKSYLFRARKLLRDFLEKNYKKEEL
ncbi:MAG TPA: sigma-70 family RNA polymerase sigma factor [Puia sp.]|nr:sigma-70 family RNA polymerase sigma factor [Puia sp.]